MEIGGKTYYALINTIYGVRYVVVSVKHYVCCIYDLRKGKIKSIISDERKSYEVKQ